jgi:hypothetical protein
MAIYYCDFTSGSDSNNGLTPSTPKISLSACTNLVSAYGNEIRVRGTDNYYVETTGYIWWRNGSTSLTGTTNLTGVLSANTYIWKDNLTNPEPIKINSLSWNGSVMTITLLLTSGTYEGTTEYTKIRMLNLGAYDNANHKYSKDGFYSGSTTDWNARTGITISGGWDATYTSRTCYTLVYSNSATNTWIIDGNAKKYWDTYYFILVRHPSVVRCVGNFTYSSFQNCVFISQERGTDTPNAYALVKNCYYYYCGSYLYAICAHIGNKFISPSYQCFMAANNQWGHFIDNTFSNFSAFFVNVGYPYPPLTIWSGNTILATSHTIFYNHNGNLITNNYIRTTGLISQVGVGSIFKDNTIASNNTINLDSSTYINTSVNINNNTYAIKYYNSNNETFTIPTTAIYGGSSNNDNYAVVDEVVSTYKLKNNNNALLYDLGMVQTTGITYDGTSSLKITQYGATACKVGTIEFVVNNSQIYNLSFWVKSSHGQSFTYNFLHFANYVSSTWYSGTTSSSTWTNITMTLPSVSVSGLFKMYIRFGSGAGRYIYVSNIQITTS